MGVPKLTKFLCDSSLTIIIVYSKNEGDHMDQLRVVLHVLKEHQLFAKYRKCEFWLRPEAFLGHIISSEGIEVDPKKT